MYFQAINIRGPKDKPDFANMDWVSVSITYQINTTESTNPVTRTVTVTNTGAIAELRSRMLVHELKGMSVACTGQLAIQMQDGKIWDGCIRSAQSIHLSKRSDNWYTYSVDLADTRLVDGMIALCTRNEQIYHPNATTNSIMLYSIYGKDYPPLL